MALVAWSPWFLPLAILWVGNRQLGLFILMHDAAHAVLHPSRRINDAVGFWFCGTEMPAYRAYHLQHHRYVQQTEDPDLVLSAPFPISRASLRRKMWRDISGQTFYKQRMAPGVMAWRSPPPGLNRWSSLGQWLRKECWFLGGNAIFALAFAAAGWGWLWLCVWWLPMATWLPLITRLRNISEHALVAANEPDPLNHARTTQANLWERMWLAPYWVNYHCEHHMFTQIPCWNLPLAHRVLHEKGVTARMNTAPSYAALLRQAAPE
jgi:fatty acid desaturase